jgi:XapX domain-containing protein
MIFLHVALVGILVGAAYALLRVDSPAPPVKALVGLLGMLVAGTILSAL